jgi:hypothetical protein
LIFEITWTEPTPNRGRTVAQLPSNGGGMGSRRGAERQLHADERDQQQHHD